MYRILFLALKKMRMAKITPRKIKNPEEVRFFKQQAFKACVRYFLSNFYFFIK